MVRRFAKVSEEETEEAYFFPSDLVNTKTTIPLDALRVSIYPPLFTSPLGDSCVCVICLSLWLRQITQTLVLIIHDILLNLIQ